MLLPPPIIPASPTPSFSPSVEGGHAGAAEALGVLKRCGWPTDVVVLDYETYFDAKYKMGKEGLATICYIEDPKFEEQGVASLIIKSERSTTPRAATFWPNVEEELAWLQTRYGRNLERATVVWFNGRFDGTILARKHEIDPPYCVDVRDLSKHLDARNTHNLKDCCARWGVPPKGETIAFLGKRWSTMSAEERVAYAGYACRDAESEADLFCLLLPKLTRPEVELPLSVHTLKLFTQPALAFDFTLADELSRKMDGEIEGILESVSWVLND